LGARRERPRDAKAAASPLATSEPLAVPRSRADLALLPVQVPAAAWTIVRVVAVMVAAALATVGVSLLLSLVGELVAPAAAESHHDFLAFYAAGVLVLHGQAAGMYDAAAVTAVQRTIIPFAVGANGYMPFINPPFAAVAFAPLAALGGPAARVAWALANGAVALTAAAWISRDLSGWRRAAATVLVVLSFPVYHALAEGQWSIILLGAGLIALHAARRGRWGVAGIALSLFWLKPQFIVLPLLALAAARRWRAVAWAVAGGVALTVVSLPFTGPGVYVQYVTYLLEVAFSHFNGAGAVHASAWQGDLATTEGINGLLVGYLGQRAIAAGGVGWALLSAAVLGAYVLAARAQPPSLATPRGRLQVAAGIAVVMLVDPNLFAQDCVLVFLLLDALRPLPPGARMAATLGVVALAATVLLDQVVEPWHLFPTLLLVGVAGAAWLAVRSRRTAASPPAVRRRSAAPGWR
jgi:hypothetical protein